MLFFPQSPSWVPNVKGEWTHRWGLSKARDMLYNTHRLCCAMHLQGRVPHIGYAKLCSLTSRASKRQKWLLTQTQTHRQQRVQEGSSAWRVHSIHSEGQTGKDRWCTSDCKGQETLRCSPECCYLSHKTDWPRTTDVVNPKSEFQKLKNYKKDNLDL